MSRSRAERHGAAMSLFRLIGVGATVKPTPHGVRVYGNNVCPVHVADAARPHAHAIGEIVRLRYAEPHRLAADLPDHTAPKRHADPRRGEPA